MTAPREGDSIFAWKKSFDPVKKVKKRRIQQEKKKKCL